jgi:hypothetical protein
MAEAFLAAGLLDDPTRNLRRRLRAPGAPSRPQPLATTITRKPDTCAPVWLRPSAAPSRHCFVMGHDANGTTHAFEYPLRLGILSRK